MKRFIAITALAAALVALLASTALAAGPVFGRWAQGTNPPTPNTCPAGESCGRAATCPMGGSGMMRGSGMMGRMMNGQPDEVGALLGMTDEQIQAERQAGKSLAQIAASKGVSEDQLVETILAARKSALQQAVTAGNLTQAQADQMLQNMTTMVRAMVERTTTGPMMGRRQGQGGQGAPGSGMMGPGMRGQVAPGLGL